MMYVSSNINDNCEEIKPTSNVLANQFLFFTEFKRVTIVDPKPTMEIYPERERVDSENGSIYTSSGDIVLNSGENFTIECFGDYPIKLIFKSDRVAVSKNNEDNYDDDDCEIMIFRD